MPSFPGYAQTLLIGSNVRFLAENAVKNKRGVFTIDYYGDWDHKILCPNRSVRRDGDGEMNLHSLIRLAIGVPNSGVAYCGGFENDIFALSRLSDIGLVYGCSIETVRKARDPESLARASQAWNFLYPKVIYEKNLALEGKWLAKPFAGLGGVGVRHMEDERDSASGRVYYQAYVKGMPSSAMVVSNGSEATLLGITTQIIGDKTFGASGFRYVGNVFPHPFAKEMMNVVTAIADSLTLEFDLKGLWGFDFIYDGGVNLIEINPRPTSAMGLLDMATWNDLLGLHMDSSLGRPSNLIVDPGPSGRYFAQGRVFAKTDSIFNGAPGWYEKGARDIPYDGEFIAAGDPVLTLSASATSYTAAFNKLRQDAEFLLSSLSPATPASSL